MQIERVARTSSPAAMDVASRTASGATRTTTAAMDRMRRPATDGKSAPRIPSPAPAAPAFPSYGYAMGIMTAWMAAMRR